MKFCLTANDSRIAVEIRENYFFAFAERSPFSGVAISQKPKLRPK